MIEATITAEDLSLYALGLLEGDEQAHVEAMLRKSTAAREELANIRGDLALFALGAEQHTPPALTRQRLLKQVARERRTVPVNLPLHGGGDRASGHTFSADREHLGRTNDLPDHAVGRNGNGPPQKVQPPAELDDSMDPLAQQILAGDPKSVQTRTFPTRTQQKRAAAALSRIPAESPALNLEASAESFTVDAVRFAAESARYRADRQKFTADPRVFPREARTLETSATAHSVTMFEQHFAADVVERAPEPELPPDPEVYSGTRRKEPAEALAEVQDHFVASNNARPEPFAFSSYRDREAEEARADSAARWMTWSGWGVAAAITIAALLSLRDDFNLREQVSEQRSSLAASDLSAAKAEAVMQTLQSPSAQNFLLARTDAAPSPTGRVAYLPERGTLVFQGSNLETLQPYKTYELWLIPAGEGRQPVPAGLFKPDGKGYATVILPQMPKGMVAANFGVTIEDEGGSATPTLPIILISQGA